MLPLAGDRAKLNIAILFAVQTWKKPIDTPGALEKTEGGKVIGRFEEVGFGRSFIDNTEAEELHDAAGSVTPQTQGKGNLTCSRRPQPTHLQVEKEIFQQELAIFISTIYLREETVSTTVPLQENVENDSETFKNATLMQIKTVRLSSEIKLVDSKGD